MFFAVEKQNIVFFIDNDELKNKYYIDLIANARIVRVFSVIVYAVILIGNKFGSTEINSNNNNEIQ